MSNEIIKQWGSKSLHLFIYCAFLFPLIVMLYPLTNTWDASFNKVLGAIPFLFETYFPFVVGKAIWMHICIELAFLVWIVLFLRYGSLRPLSSKIFSLLGLYLVASILAAVFGVSFERSFWSTYERMQGIFDLIHWLIFVFLLTSTFTRLQHWIKYLKFILGISLLMGILGVSQYLHIPLLPFFTGIGGRVDITLGNPTYVGTYAAICICLASSVLGFYLFRNKSFLEDKNTTIQNQLKQEISLVDLIRQYNYVIFFIAFGVVCLILSYGYAFLMGVVPLIGFIVGQVVLKFDNYGYGWRSVYWYSSILGSLAIVWLLKSPDVAIGLFGVILGFLFSHSFWKDGRTSFWSLFLVITIIFNLMNLYFSLSRGALIGLISAVIVVSFVSMIWSKHQKIKFISKLIFLFLSSLIFLGILFLGFGKNNVIAKTLVDNSNLAARIATIGLNDQSFKGRYNALRAGLIAFQEKPFFGWGPENFTIAYDKHVTKQMVSVSATSFDQAHNKILEELVTKGLVGFIFYLAIWIYLANVFIRQYRHTDSRNQILILGLGAGLVAYFVQNLFLFDSVSTVGLFWVLVAFVIGIDNGVLSNVDLVSDATTKKKKKYEQPKPVSEFRLLTSFRRLITYPLGFTCFIVIVVIGSVFFIYSFNIKAYNASSNLLTAQNPVLTWNERIEIYDNSIDEFPYLANYPRVELLNQMLLYWQYIDDNDIEFILKTADKYVEDGMINQPEDWRLLLSLGSLYQKASARGESSYLAPGESSYLDKSAKITQRALSRAPTRIETTQLLVLQHAFNKDYTSSKEVIADYINDNPDGEEHLCEIIVLIDQSEYLAKFESEGKQPTAEYVPIKQCLD